MSDGKRRHGAGWSDVSGERAAEQAEYGCRGGCRLRQAFNAIPLPVWRRDRSLRLIDCNNAYAGALDSLRQTVLSESRELSPESGREKARALARAAANGTIKSERRHIVIGGSRRLLEVCELPDGAGGTIGFAVDRTDLESAEGELARNVNAHGQVLENIHAAVAIYGADKRLSFFNSAFARLWSIEEDWLAGHPSTRFSACANAAASRNSPISGSSSGSRAVHFLDRAAAR